MGRPFPLWACVLLPWAAAAITLVFARGLVRAFGSRRATAAAQYLGLGATAMAVMFGVQALRQLTASEDGHALSHLPLPELLTPVQIGVLEFQLGLIGDRISVAATVVIAVLVVVVRVFIGGPAGLRDLGLGPEHGPRAWLLGDERPADPDTEADVRAATTGIRQLGLIGVLEGAAILTVLAGDLMLTAIAWAILGLGSVAAIARRFSDEARASAATRVLILHGLSDASLVAALVCLAIAGIGVAHAGLWPVWIRDHLYAPLGPASASEWIAAGLLGAALLRLLGLARASNSLAEALIDSVLLPVPAVYLLIRHHRVLGFAPTMLAATLVLGVLLAAFGSAVALSRPTRGAARRSDRAGMDQSLAGTSVAWIGLIAMAIGVGAWRTAVWLVLAQALGRLGLRLALLVESRTTASTWTARIACWSVAGIAPALGFAALAQTGVDVLTRNGLLGGGFGALAATVVVAVAFAHAAAIARIWYERSRGGARPDASEEDALDLFPLAVLAIASLVLGGLAIGSWFGLARPPMAWLDGSLPIAGGHESMPLGVAERYREGTEASRPWVAGCAVLVALVTGFAWMWARQTFRRRDGDAVPAVASVRSVLEWIASTARRLARGMRTALAGLAQLAAHGVGRGVFETGVEIAGRLASDFGASARARARRSGLALGGARWSVLGLVLGVALLLGWLYARPDVASLLPTDGYGFGGLKPKLIRAGGLEDATGEGGE